MTEFEVEVVKLLFRITEALEKQVDFAQRAEEFMSRSVENNTAIREAQEEILNRGRQ